ncbi:MAG: site-specific integrase [Candidatus Acidiferrales bacterium]
MAGMPQLSNSASRPDPADALERACNQRRRNAGTSQTERQRRTVPLSRENRQSVYVPLPHDIAESLRNIPPGPSPNPRYFFWSGNGSPKSVVGNWQRSFRRLFTIANIRRDDGSPKRCHPHMFRDTFAVEMLLAGVPLEQVSILLGHKSVKITEKHYAPWVKARQDQLAANVRMAWKISGSADKASKRKAPKSVRRSA